MYKLLGDLSLKASSNILWVLEKRFPGLECFRAEGLLAMNTPMVCLKMHQMRPFIRPGYISVPKSSPFGLVLTGSSEDTMGRKR